jgi:hypothetical protein
MMMEEKEAWRDIFIPSMLHLIKYRLNERCSHPFGKAVPEDLTP